MRSLPIILLICLTPAADHILRINTSNPSEPRLPFLVTLTSKLPLKPMASPHLTNINATKKRSVCPPNPSTPHVEATGFFSSLPFQFQDAPFLFLETLASPISSPSKTQAPDLCLLFFLKPIHACMDWSAMIPGLLKHITDKLPHRFDYMNFRLVCKSWLSVAPPKNFPPTLILPSHPNSGELHYIDPGAGGVHSLALPEAARNKISVALPAAGSPFWTSPPRPCPSSTPLPEPNSTSRQSPNASSSTTFTTA